MPALLFSNGVLRFCCVSPGIMSQTYDWGKYTMVILLVDSDQKALDREAKRLAEHQGAVTAYLHSSASEAIDFVQSNDVDVVYTRQMLSDMSGEELIGRIKQLRPGVEGHILSRGEPVPIPVCGCVDEEFAAREGNAQAQHKEHEDSIGQALENTFFGKRGRLETKQKGDGKMTERELRGLGRRDLLELMIEQGRQMEAYQEKYESDLDFMKSEHDKDIEQLKEDYEKDIRDISASKDSLSRELDALRRERDSLKREADSLRRELDTAREELKSRKIAIDKAGSIAVAALQLNGIFEAAQAAGQQYIENIKALSERQDAVCAERDARNKIEIENRLRETAVKCAEMEANSRKKCETMEAEAKQRADGYWKEVSSRLQSFYDNHRELKRLLNLSTSNYDVNV